MITAIAEPWYSDLIEELKALITETEFTHRWTLIEGRHQLGVRILQENDNFERAKIYGQGILQHLAKSLGKSERTLAYTVKFAKLYPDLNLLPEGKTVSWNHIINKYLTDGTEKKIIKKFDLYRMIKEIKDLLEIEYLKAHQEEINLTPASFGYDSNKAIIEFIRYLQDQVNKIIGGIDE